MAEAHEELQEIAASLERLAARGREERVQKPLDLLSQVIKGVERAWSGSWHGYQANVYYRDLQPSPPGATFSPEWGGSSRFIRATVGDWVEYDPMEVEKVIYARAGDPDMSAAVAFHDEAAREFRLQRLSLLSIVDLEANETGSPFLKQLKEQVDALLIVSQPDVVKSWCPEKVMSRDPRAQGFRTPAHLSVSAKVASIRHTLRVVDDLGALAGQIAKHLSRRQTRQHQSAAAGSRVFLGHGHSPVWRELKDFIEERLNLPVDEFNRVPTAGVTNTKRLSEMMDEAGFAFLIMTGEDERSDGSVHPRENVIHEAGLFQGRLGFNRAIILLEEGCKEFSNVEGLGQIRFPKDNVKSAFEEIRRVLEREGMLISS